MDLRVESQDELNKEMDKLIKKKKLFEMDQEKLNIQIQQFEIYKRKTDRDLRELQNLRGFKRKIMESGNFPDNIDLEDRGVDILHSQHNLTHIMDESRKNNQTRAILAADVNTFFNRKKEFEVKLAKFQITVQKFESLRKEHKNEASQLETDKKVYQKNVENKNKEYMDDFANYQRNMSNMKDAKDEIDLKQKILLSVRAEHEQNFDEFSKSKSNFQKEQEEHKLDREAFSADQRKDQRLREIIKKEHEDREKNHKEQLQHIQNKHNDHQDKSEKLNTELDSFKKQQNQFLKLQMEQSKNIKLYQKGLAKLYAKEDQLDDQKREHKYKMEAYSQIHEKAKEHEKLKEKIADKEKIQKQLDIKAKQHYVDKQRLKDDGKALEMKKKQFTKKQLQFDENMKILHDEIDAHERNVKNYHIAKKDLFKQKSAHSTSQELLDARNNDLQKQISKHKINKLTFEEQKEQLLELVEQHRLDVAELKKSQEEVAHLTSVYNDEQSWHSSEKDLNKRRKNIHDEKMHNERILIIEQKNQHFKKLSDHHDLETKLEEEKIKFNKQFQKFTAKKMNTEKEHQRLEEQLTKRAEDLQYREKRLEHDQIIYKKSLKLSKSSLEYLQNPRYKTDKPRYETAKPKTNVQTDKPNLYSQGSQTNKFNQEIEDKNVRQREEINYLKKEKEELLQQLKDFKNKYAIEQYNYMKQKQQHQKNLSDHKKDVGQLVKSQELQDACFEQTQKEFEALKAVLHEEKRKHADEKEHFSLDKQILDKQTKLLAQKELHLNSRIDEYEDIKKNVLKGLDKHQKTILANVS